MTVVVFEERLAPDWRLLRTSDGLVRLLRDPPCADRAFDPFARPHRCAAEELLQTLFPEASLPFESSSPEDAQADDAMSAHPANEDRGPGGPARSGAPRRPMS